MRHPTLIRLAIVAAVGASAALAPRRAEAQTGKVTVTVTDSATGRGIDAVQVSFQGTGYGGVTNSAGRFFMVAVPPGTYTVVARRIGYGSQQTRINVAIDVTREVNFRLSSSTSQLTAVKIVETTQPLVERNATGTTTQVTAQELEALPVRSIRDALALQPGFSELPTISTDLTSFAASRRNDVPSIQIRGGRGGETLTLIDDIPVNNFLFGGSTLDITNQAYQSFSTIQGFMEPQYGNALSGVVSIATREGGSQLAGSLNYETSRLGGNVFNMKQDALRNYDFVEGFLSGPVPATGDKLRFVFAGRSTGRARQVLEFDDQIYNPVVVDTADRFSYQSDLLAGWRALGFTDQRDMYGKLTYLFTPTTKLSLGYIDYSRSSSSVPFDWVLTGYSSAEVCRNTYTPIYGDRIDVANVCNAFYDADRVATNGRPLGSERNAYVRPAVQTQLRNLYTLRFEQTLGRLYYKVVGGFLDQSRQTCSTFFSGICLEDRIADTNFNNRFVVAGVTSPALTPTEGTDEIAGNDAMKTRVLRADVQIQATDHHNLQAGVFYQGHDLRFHEARDVGLNNVQVQLADYSARPWDGAAYIQDRIEYDFLTVKLGARFDYGVASGTFLRDPLDPTNGTTQLTVCNDPARFGLPANFATYRDPATGQTFTGFAACSKNQALGDTAVNVAFRDDMGPSPVRRAFSPRVGFSFPVTERSNAYFNFGVYYQNPLYNNVYQGTGIGTDEEGQRSAPQFRNQTYVGNPRLLAEQTTQYEFGFNSEFGRNLGVTINAYTKDQSGLTGIRSGGFLSGTDTRVFDPGVTYGNNAPSYTISVNQDFTTVRGFQVVLRRRLANNWRGNINYSFMQANTNASPPDLENQRTQEEGDIPARSEIRSDIDQRHAIRGQVVLEARDEAPAVRFGRYLRNASLSATMSLSSGYPYTPSLTFTGNTRDRLERNSGSAPNIFDVNVQAQKNWTVANLRYGAFFRVSNLLDRKNCAQVYATTGNCFGGASPQARLQAGNFTGTGEGTTFFDRPHYLYDRRAINAGVNVNF